MTQTDIDRIRDRCTKATTGPWHWEAEDASVVALYGPKGCFDFVLWSDICESCQKHGGRCTTPNEADAAFIANARTDIPILVAEVERLRALLKKAHDAMFSWFSSEYAAHPLSVEVNKGLYQ